MQRLSIRIFEKSMVLGLAESKQLLPERRYGKFTSIKS